VRAVGAGEHVEAGRERLRDDFERLRVEGRIGQLEVQGVQVARHLAQRAARAAIAVSIARP
jgi:hypothetical protein